MKSLLIIAAILFVLICSCKTKSHNVSERVKENLISHVNKIDSNLVLGSFTVTSIDTINRRMERVIDDTLYMREFNRVQTQLSDAMKGTRADSIAFYQGEVNYMQTQFDSLNRAILNADTTKKLGLLVTSKIQLTKNNKSEETTVYYFLDWNMKVWNPEMIDTVIMGLSRKLN